MALNYTQFRATAERLIEENGRTITLVRKDQGNPVDPTEPWRASTNAAEITFDVLGVFIEFEKDEVDGTIVMRGDKRVLVAAKSVTDEGGSAANLDIEDYSDVLDGGTRYRIITSSVIEPGDTRIMYDLQVRQ
jgi:hypothetical protein